MSKAKITFLIIALVLIIAGGTLFGVCYARGARYDDNIQFVNKTYDLTEEFNSIDLELGMSKLEIVKAETNKVEVSETDKFHHEVKVVENKLQIKTIDDTQWYEKFLIFGDKYSVKISLNKDVYDSLNVKNGTGSLTISNPFTFTNFTVENGTGGVKASNLTLTSLKINSGTGSVDLSNITAGNIDINTSTGSKTIQDVHATNIKLTGSTASNRLTNVIADNELYVKSSTGSIKFDGIDAATIYMESSTGSIRGSVLTEKTFIPHSSTGSVRVPTNTTGGTCTLKTSTGSIDVTIKA